MDICLIGDNGYVEYMSCFIVSLLKNSNYDDNFSIHIIEEDISDDNKNKLISLKNIKPFNIYFYRPINIEKYKSWEYELKKIDKSSLWNYKIFIKLDIPLLLKDLDKVLYLDIDQIVLSSINKFFTIDISKYYIMGIQIPKKSFDTGLDFIDQEENFRNFVNDIGIENPKKDYLVSNIIMFNLKLIKEEYGLSKLDEQTNQCFSKYKNAIHTDEHVFLYLFSNKMVFVDWSCNIVNDYPENDIEIENREIKIYHFWGPKKPLSPKYLQYNYRNNFDKYYYLFWKYFVLTPFFIEDSKKYMQIFASHFYEEKTNNLYIDQTKEINKNNAHSLCILGLERNDKYIILNIFGIKITIKRNKKY